LKILLKKTLRLILLTVGHLKIRARQKPKVFVIGANKTGTTSLKKFLSDLGYRMGPQRQFEFLLFDYFDGKWERIMHIIKNYEAFQDVPFSKATNEFISKLRQQYPDAKFILSTRDDASEWYHSLLRFHRKKWFRGKEIIQWEDVKRVNYVVKELSFKRALKYHSIDALPLNYEKLPYDQEILERWYNSYNSRMVKLFEGDPNFVVVNLKDQDTADQLKIFLGHTSSEVTIDRLNSTAVRRTVTGTG
jgi:hypothetical protein